MSLTGPEIERYGRQLVLPEWSGAAQRRLAEARVLVVGAGALGSPVAAYLAGAGVGRLEVLDPDLVELSNLHRQLLHSTPDIGVPKAESAAARVGALNPEVDVVALVDRLGAENARSLVSGCSLVVDCSDSFDTRYAVNEACCRERVPLVEAGVLGLDGLVISIRPGESACYRCAFPVAPPSGSVTRCREAGILGPVAGIVGSIQALEALKLLGGVGAPLLDRILQIDGRDLAPVTVRTARREDCPACARAAVRAQSG